MKPPHSYAGVFMYGAAKPHHKEIFSSLLKL